MSDSTGLYCRATGYQAMHGNVVNHNLVHNSHSTSLPNLRARPTSIVHRNISHRVRKTKQPTRNRQQIQQNPKFQRLASQSAIVFANREQANNQQATNEPSQHHNADSRVRRERLRRPADRAGHEGTQSKRQEQRIGPL